MAASTATPTTSIAPTAIERIALLSTIHSPASEMITVSPLNSTSEARRRQRHPARVLVAAPGGHPSR